MINKYSFNLITKKDLNFEEKNDDELLNIIRDAIFCIGQSINSDIQNNILSEEIRMDILSKYDIKKEHILSLYSSFIICKNIITEFNKFSSEDKISIAYNLYEIFKKVDNYRKNYMCKNSCNHYWHNIENLK